MTKTQQCSGDPGRSTGVAVLIWTNEIETVESLIRDNGVSRRLDFDTIRLLLRSGTGLRRRTKTVDGLSEEKLHRGTHVHGNR